MKILEPPKLDEEKKDVPDLMNKKSTSEVLQKGKKMLDKKPDAKTNGATGTNKNSK